MKLRSCYQAIFIPIIALAITSCDQVDTLFGNHNNNNEWQDISDLGLPTLATNRLTSFENVDSVGTVKLHSISSHDTDLQSTDSHDNNSMDSHFQNNTTGTQLSSNLNSLESNGIGMSDAGSSATRLNNTQSYTNETGNNKSLLLDKAQLLDEQAKKCPKKLELKIDSNTIQRNHDVLINNYCDYYVYPSKGQKIMVGVSPAKMEAYLIAPQIHDFENGWFEVKQNDAHVIRVEFTGYKYHSTPINYNLKLTIES